MQTENCKNERNLPIRSLSQNGWGIISLFLNILVSLYYRLYDEQESIVGYIHFEIHPTISICFGLFAYAEIDCDPTTWDDLIVFDIRFLAFDDYFFLLFFTMCLLLISKPHCNSFSTIIRMT